MNCEGNSTDPWCFCFNNKGNPVPQYKQYNANSLSEKSTGKGFHCCNILHYDPSFLADNLPDQGFIANAYDYLVLMNNNVTNDVCDYSVFLEQVNNNFEFEQKFPDLYDNADKARLIFNGFFNKNNEVHEGKITNNQDLVPTFTNNNVSCPNSNYIPYSLNYDINKYIFVCHPKKSAFPKIGIDYQTFYFYDNNDNDCKRNSCNTSIKQSTFGYNVGNPAYNSKGTNKVSTEIIVIIVIASICLVVFLGYLFYYIYQTIKENNLKNRSEY